MDRISCLYIYTNTIRSKDLEIAYHIEERLLETDISNDLKLYIIVNEEDKFENIENFYNQFLLDEKLYIKITDLELLLKKYGYNELLDKHIINKIDDVKLKESIINTIKANKFNLSNTILEKLDAITNVYEFSDYYNELFKEKGFYKLLIYSKAINDKKFKLDMDLINNDKYGESLFKVYKNMGIHFKNYDFTIGFTNKIVNDMDFTSINYNNSNFWKIDLLIPSLNTYTKCVKVFDQLNNNNMISEYAIYYKNNNKLQNLSFIENLKTYSAEMTPAIKRNITIALNKVKERSK